MQRGRDAGFELDEQVRAAMAHARDGLAAFTLLWCAQQALLLFYTQLASRFDRVQALLVAAAALSSAWPALCAALIARIYANVACWPKYATEASNPRQAVPRQVCHSHV
jgi:Co/Zn/Cd efflux system component